MSLRARLDTDHVAWLDRFVPAETCRRLLAELEFTLWRPSTVVDRTADGELLSREHRGRRSETTGERWFGEELLGELRAVERRACAEIGADPSYLETWQAVRYGVGDRFDVHHDGGVFADEDGGERSVTLLLHLETPAAGGATWFPELDLEVAAVAGRLVAWRNLRPDGTIDPTVRHAGRPVGRGGKTILTTWSRERPIRRSDQP